MDNLKYILESLLFVSSSPLPMDRLRQAIPEADARTIRQTLEDLEREYEFRDGGFSLHHVAGGYQLRTKPEYAQWIKRLHQTQPVRLSKAALETLAIIAYRQPALRSDIDYIRGVDSGGVVKLLLEKQLIRVLGRDKEKAGRPMLYSTTKRFLEIFDLKDLSELPTLKELEELGLADKMDRQDNTEPAVEGAAGFAEFQNLKDRPSLDEVDFDLDDQPEVEESASGEEENQEQASAHESEDGEAWQSEADEFTVDSDRYPQEVQEDMDISEDLVEGWQDASDAVHEGNQNHEHVNGYDTQDAPESDLEEVLEEDVEEAPYDNREDDRNNHRKDDPEGDPEGDQKKDREDELEGEPEGESENELEDDSQGFTPTVAEEFQ